MSDHRDSHAEWAITFRDKSGEPIFTARSDEEKLSLVRDLADRADAGHVAAGTFLLQIAIGRVSWSVVVLIAGVLTYIAVLQRAGTVEWVSNGISTVSIPLVAALLLFYFSGFVSALASSLGVISVVIALAVPFLQSGDVHVAGFVAALAISATIVDISPFSTGGAMVLANVRADIRDWYYKRMLAYAGLMCLIGPGLAWFVAAVPTWVG